MAILNCIDIDYCWEKLNNFFSSLSYANRDILNDDIFYRFKTSKSKGKPFTIQHYIEIFAFFGECLLFIDCGSLHSVQKDNIVGLYAQIDIWKRLETLFRAYLKI